MSENFAIEATSTTAVDPLDAALAAGFGPADEGVFGALQAGLEVDLLPVLVGAAATNEPGAAESGATVRYKIVGEIARGGMGMLVQGRDTTLQRDLVFKVLREDHQENPELRRRFVEEARLGSQLQHPGIVPVYELGQWSDHRPCFTMKLVKGRTLAELLRDRSSPADDLPRFVQIFEQISQTVAYAHSKGVIHRDLKPANIMVGEFGEVLVMDWGLAKVLGDKRTDGGTPPEFANVSEAIQAVRGGSDESQPGTVMGTPAYMSPEQARGEVDRLDARCDVFALGAILCEILTGKPPYIGDFNEVRRMAAAADLADALARLDQSGASKELRDLAFNCLRPELETRTHMEELRPGEEPPKGTGELLEDIDGNLVHTGDRLAFSLDHIIPGSKSYYVVFDQVGRLANAGEVANGMKDYHARLEKRIRAAALAEVRAEEGDKWRRIIAVIVSAPLLMVLFAAGGILWVYFRFLGSAPETWRAAGMALTGVVLGLLVGVCARAVQRKPILGQFVFLGISAASLIALAFGLHSSFGHVNRTNYDQIRTHADMTLADVEHVMGRQGIELQSDAASQVLQRMLEQRSNFFMDALLMNMAEKQGVRPDELRRRVNELEIADKRVLRWGHESCFIHVVVDGNDRVFWKESRGL